MRFYFYWKFSLLTLTSFIISAPSSEYFPCEIIILTKMIFIENSISLGNRTAYSNAVYKASS